MGMRVQEFVGFLKSDNSCFPFVYIIKIILDSPQNSCQISILAKSGEMK